MTCYTLTHLPTSTPMTSRRWPERLARRRTHQAWMYIPDGYSSDRLSCAAPFAASHSLLCRVLISLGADPSIMFSCAHVALLHCSTDPQETPYDHLGQQTHAIPVLLALQATVVVDIYICMASCQQVRNPTNPRVWRLRKFF